MAAGGGEPRYTVEFSRPAARELAGLPQDARQRIAARIDALAVNPRPNGVEKLKGEDDQYRVRVGDYRVIYTIRDARLIVLVLRIGDPRDVYRRGGN